jgi:membrane protease YdiL (CAAX protease family)
MTWLYLASGESVIPSILLHASNNFSWWAVASVFPAALSSGTFGYAYMGLLAVAGAAAGLRIHRMAGQISRESAPWAPPAVP